MTQREQLDFKAVAERALAQARELLSEWLPGGKYEGPEYIVKNPTRSDGKPGSFTINTASGAWGDFATGDKGGDLVSLVAYVTRSNQADACKAVAGWLGIDPTTPDTRFQDRSNGYKGNARKATPPADWQPILPAPAAALASCPTTAPKLGRPSHVWEYLDAGGRLLLKVLRFDFPQGDGRPKEYRPLCYGTDAKGTGWRWKQPTERRPLYGLDRLAAAPATVPVLLCEGEKGADAARELFPDAVAMTWLSGSKAIGKADFTPLAGRRVWYWPDHDKAGRDSIAPLAKHLKQAKAEGLALVDVSLFERHRPGDQDGAPALLPVTADQAASQWPEKADAADALALGWTAAHIALLQPLGLIGELAPYQDKPNTGNSASTPPEATQGRFRTTDQGLFYFDPKTEGYRRIGGRLEIVARSRNSDSRAWGLLVAFDDFDGRRKEWNIPAALFATEGGAEVIRGLLDRGYSLSPTREARRYLLEYLGGHQTAERVRLVERMGWHQGAFLLPDRVLGDPPERLHYYSDAPPLCKMAQAGTLEGWRQQIGALCVNSSRLTFAVSAAFAAPLLDVLGSETCGFHFVGDSSLGKSTLLKVAASVCGHPDRYPRTWRATDNALEATAAAHSDCLLVLDEIGQIEPRIVGETVYMLGNGEGKARATETGGARSGAHRWRLVFLSSGEKTLLDHMAEANKKPQAGMEMRLLTVPASPHTDSAKQQRLGIFEAAEPFAGGAEFSGHLMEQAERHHGAPLLALLEHLTTSDRAKLVAWISDRKAAFKRAQLDQGSSGQAHRAADKFALVAAAGELATKLGITGWPKGWATTAAEACYRAWLHFRGGPGNLEDRQALDHVRLMLTKYGESRFTRWENDAPRVDEHTPRTMERWGFRKTEEEKDSYLGDATEAVYYVTPDGFKDMCKGQDWRRVARVLRDANALETDADGKRNTKKVRLPGSGKSPVNCYVIRLAVLLAQDTDAPAPDPHDDIPGF